MAIYRQLNQLLLNSGLPETEVLVYMELLKKPASTIWEIVKRTGFSKSVVYRAFEHLKEMKMVEKTDDEIKALSLKALVGKLNSEELKLRKTALKLKQVAPFLHVPREPVEVFETFHHFDQIRDVYLFMSESMEGVNLDFGDFENFIPKIGGIETGNCFRKNRIKNASHHAICTTFGPYTAHYSTKEAEKHFRNKVDLLNVDLKNKFIIFSDTNDYVLFNHFEDEENPYSVLVKSKAIADIQRAQFGGFSQKFGN